MPRDRYMEPFLGSPLFDSGVSRGKHIEDVGDLGLKCLRCGEEITVENMTEIQNQYARRGFLHAHKNCEGEERR